MAEEVQQTSPQVEQAVVVTVRGMDVEDPSLWHHLIFCEELENDGVVCCLCQQPVLACPGYKCLQCNFFQHKLCIDRPDGVDIEIEHKYWWKRHHLIFIQDPDNKVDVCSVCKDPTIGPAYKCSVPECSFILHKSCGELSNVIHHHPLHSEHALILREPSSTGNNDCFFCRKNCSGSLFYRCTLCSFNLHVICASRRKINPNDCHQHKLLSSREENEFTCESCGKETAEHIANLCSECGVLIHKRCDFKHTIKTRSHDHSLFRTYSLCPVEEHDNVFCKICPRKINAGAYYCKKCDYIVHMSCAYEFEDEGNNGISATPEVDATELVHLVEEINLTEDERASSQEIKHFSHPQHNLILILSDEKLVNDMRCEACMRIIFGTPFYGCAQCNFFLHNRCAKLPPTIKRWRFHKHSLTLHSQARSPDGLFECRACECLRHGFTYGCDECKWYEVDIQCCLIPETLLHEGHQHLLRLINLVACETWNCNACSKNYACFLMCMDCEFRLCLRCATLPLVAKYEFDTHLLLKLSYAWEDNLEEYYCLICEEKRDHPDHWFYSCVKCKFTAHTQCVIGMNPCIKFGKTYIDEDHPEHPLTIVEKADHSPPCDSCNESFYSGVALECTQCKFNVHPNVIDCYCLGGVRDTSPDTASDSTQCDGSD